MSCTLGWRGRYAVGCAGREFLGYVYEDGGAKWAECVCVWCTEQQNEKKSVTYLELGRMICRGLYWV